MAELIDDSRYSRGTGLFSVYHEVDLPKNPTDCCLALFDLGTRSLLADEFIILDFLPFPGLGQLGPDDVLQFSWILSESHRLMVYDPKTRRLIDELYTCSPEKTGARMFEATNRAIGKPVESVKVDEIVNKEMALQEEPHLLHHSVEEAAKKLGIVPDKQYCVSSVFFDLTEHKLDEDSLEGILTKALNKDDQKPVIETACRYAPQGYTYTHQSPKHFAGLHSYPGKLKSAHLSLIGKGDAVLSVLNDVEEVVYKRRKTEPTISVKVVAKGF
jgi:hypothetical protein